MRKALLLCAFVSISLVSVAQSNFLNLQGGLGFGWMSGNEYSTETQTVRSVPVIGAEFAGFFNEKAFFTVGADFMKKGAWDLGIRYIENNTVVQTNSYTSDYKYLIIPMMIHKIVGSDNLFFSFGGGFFIGALLEHEHEINTGLWNIRSVKNDTEDYNMLDLGLQVRLGFRVMINEGYYFLINVNHQMGLLNTYTKTLEDGGSLKTNASFAQIGFGFKL